MTNQIVIHVGIDWANKEHVFHLVAPMQSLSQAVSNSTRRPSMILSATGELAFQEPLFPLPSKPPKAL